MQTGQWMAAEAAAKRLTALLRSGSVIVGDPRHIGHESRAIVKALFELQCNCHVRNSKLISEIVPKTQWYLRTIRGRR